MSVVVTPAEPAHAAALAALAEEMDHFYGATDIEPLDVRLRQIEEALFADPPAAYALLAWDGDRLVGFAAYSFLWPAVGLTRSLYLKELYVAEATRRQGVGQLLMRHLHDLAVKLGCSRREWMTDEFNDDAQAFYERLGVPVDEAKLFYRVESQRLREVADRPGEVT